MRPRQRFFERPGERVQARFLLAGAMAGSSKGGGKGGGGGGGTGALRRVLDRSIALQEAQFQREQPFYDIGVQRAQFGTSFLPDIENAVRNPTSNPYYNLVAREGLTQLRNNYSVTGSPSSGPSQIAGGRFMAGLEADQLNQMFNRLALAGGLGQPSPTTPQSQALTLSPTISSTASAIGDINARNNQVASQSTSGLFQGLTSLAGLFASLYSSSEKFKEDIKPIDRKAHEQMLDQLMNIPVYTWKYKDGFRDGGYHVGTTTEKAPKTVVTKDGMALDPVSYFGMLTLGYQDLSKKVDKLAKAKDNA